MRRSILILLLILVVGPVAVITAVDWGGSVTTVNTYETVPEGSDEEQFLSSQRLSLYLTTPIGRRWQFVSQAGAFLNTEPLFAADVDKLYLQRTRDFVNDEKFASGEAEQPGNLKNMVTRMGRFSLSDASGRVMSHPVDGINLSFTGQRSFVSLGVGYTGFINKEFSSVAMSIRDSIDLEDESTYFGPSRLLGRGTIDFPELFFGQGVKAGFAFQQDLRDPEDVVEPLTEAANVEEDGGLVDTQYAILELDGPIPAGNLSVFYSLGYILNTGRTIGLLEDETANSGESYQYSPIRAHLGHGKVQVFIPQFLSSVVSAGLIYSTGDGDYATLIEGNTEGNATMFTAVTPLGKGVVFGLEPGNSMTSEVSFSLKPFQGGAALESLQTQVLMYNFFRTAEGGPVSVAAVDRATDEPYLGTEVDVALRARPFSDFGVGLTTGFFFGNENVLVDDANSVDYVVRLNASLSF